MWVFVPQLQAIGITEKENNKIDVPEQKALDLVRRVLDEGVDVAYSYRMQADHGELNHCISYVMVN